jgi:hypothetical protein
VNSVRRETIDIRSEMRETNLIMTRQFGILNRNIRRVALQATQRGVVTQRGVAVQMQARLVGDSPNYGEDGGASHNPAVMNSISAGATLSPLPLNLFDLWQEYIEGIGGRKPASFFSFSERDCVKQTFHHRKILWDMISGLTRQGFTANSAIDAIYNIYGQQTSVTNIINGVKRDKKHGTLNPNLQV